MLRPRHALIGLGLGLSSVLGCGPQRLSNLDDGASSSGESTSTTESTGEDTTESTSESTTESTTDDPTETSSTDTFVPVHDIPNFGSCDSWLQDCPEDEKCVPYASTGGTWDAHKCVPLMGDQHPGEPCSYGGALEGWDDCDASSWCWNVMDVDGENVGECTSFCTGSSEAPECPLGYMCLIGSDDTIHLCIRTCDPVLQDCDPGLGCFWVGSDFQCVFTTEELPPGSACGFINDCAIGNNCTPGESLPACAGDSCCTPFCELGRGDMACASVPGTSCVPFFEQGMAPIPYEHVGVCVMP